MAKNSLRLEERMEILDLFARYNHLFEAGAAQEWAETFTPDGYFSGPAGEAQGTTALAEFCRATIARFPVALHFTDHHLFEVEGEVVRHTCILSLQFPSNEGVEILLLRYDDELVRAGDSWKFRRRIVRPASDVASR